MASGFGGGMAGAGGTCGALVGAVMTVGLVHGRSDATADRRPAYGLTAEIVAAFEQEMGSTSCRELTELDLRTPEGMKALRESGVGQRVCARAIATAERLALERLAPAP
jgi:C_GCAxxG_C_C family probable redox protein